jgi:diamine N-acetyltransferase
MICGTGILHLIWLKLGTPLGLHMTNEKAAFPKHGWDRFLLRGNKVILRSLRRDDIDKRLAWKEYPDPLYSHYNPPNLSLREREDWYLKRKHDPDMVYLAIDNHQGRLLGFICLNRIDRKAKTLWMGIFLGHEFTDRGYGTDALLTLSRYLFEKGRLEMMFLDVASHNKRAIRCYLKCGFKFVRTKYNRSDPRSNLDIFGDDKYEDIREYFKKEGDEVLVQFDDMVLTKETWFAQNPLFAN